MKSLRFVLLLFLICVAFGCPAGAETLYAGGAEYPSLTAALEAARDGDEIVLADGVYDENRETFPIVVNKRVTIRGGAGARPVISSPVTKLALRVTAADVVLEGLDIRFLRYGVWALGDRAIIRDCAVTLADEKWREASCGVWLAGCKGAIVENNAFTGCSLALAGPAQTEETHGVPVLTALFEVGEDIEYFTTHSFSGNTVNGRPLNVVIGLEDAEYAEPSGQVIAVGCRNAVFRDMDVSGGSIGLQLYYSSGVTIENVNADNSGVFGLYAAKSSDIAIIDCTGSGSSHGIDVRDVTNGVIRGCVTNDCGQGVFLSWGHNFLVDQCEMRRCGTGFFSAAGDNNHVNDCVIADAELGMYVQHEPNFTVTNSVISGNIACGTRATDCGLTCWGNRYEGNFVAVMALHCARATFGGNAFAANENRSLFLSDTKQIKWIGNAFAPDTAQNELVGCDEPVE